MASHKPNSKASTNSYTKKNTNESNEVNTLTRYMYDEVIKRALDKWSTDDIRTFLDHIEDKRFDKAIEMCHAIKNLNTYLQDHPIKNSSPTNTNTSSTLKDVNEDVDADEVGSKTTPPS
jgi:hypothetical protein